MGNKVRATFSLITAVLLALPAAAPAAGSDHDFLAPAADLFARVERFRATLGQPSGLSVERCELDVSCFYNPDGSLHHWAKAVKLRAPGGTDRWGNGKPETATTYFVTGGYAPLMKRQTDYIAWLKSTYPRNPMQIEATGKLNIRTLKIPVSMMRHEADALWSTFQSQCRAAAGARKFSVCGVDQYSYLVDLRMAAAPLRQGEIRRIVPPGPDDDQVIHIIIEGRGSMSFTREYLFPDQASKMLATLMTRCFKGLESVDFLVEQVKPYNPGVTAGAANEWTLRAGSDHLEAEQLPQGFMEQLAAAEEGASKALDDAKLFAETR